MEAEVSDLTQALGEAAVEIRVWKKSVEGRLAGLVSIGDVVKHRIAEVQDERDHLTAYIHGRAPRAQPTT